MTAAVILPQRGASRITRVVEEVSPGTTPGSAAWDRVRNTGGAGTQSEIETVESNELPGEVLGTRDIIRTGERGTFELPFELLYDNAHFLFMESLLNGRFATDVLVPGQDNVVFTLEDELPGIRESEYVRNAKVTEFSLSMQAGQIITGSYSGQGAETGVAAQRIVLPAAGLVSFTAPNIIDYTASSLPPTPPVAGDYVEISGADDPTNNGYYKIISVGADLVTVEGSVVASPSNNSVTSKFNGETQYVLTGGTGDTQSTTTAMKVGNNVDAEINGVDVLDYGLRFPQVDLTVSNTPEELREITEDAPYATLFTNRTVTVSINYHVINLYPIRQLRADQEFSLQFTVTDVDSNQYTFTFPRCKSANASKGPASREEVMTGTWELQALLDPTNVNVQIAR